MQTLLQLHSKGEYGVLRSPAWPYVREGLKRNLIKVLRYHRRNPTAVKAQHFLVRLLQNIAVPQSLAPDRYYSNVDAAALNISMALKMTSSIFKGETHKGVFYGGDNTEVLIATDDSFDPFWAAANWRDLCPIKVLRHPRSDLGLNIPDGTDTGTETGLVVVTINITLLAMQYRCFRLEQKKIFDDTGEPQQTVMQFLRMYPLPNMLWSHLDVALFNRIEKLQRELVPGESTRNYPFILTNFDDRVDIIQEDILEHLRIKTQDFVGTLKTIPAVTKETMFEVMDPPDIAPTRQVIWALVAAQIPVVLFLWRESIKNGHAKNMTEVNATRRAITAYKSDSALRDNLPLEFYLELMNDLKLLEIK